MYTVDGHTKLMPKYVRQYNLGRCYEPSFNVAPTDLTPVLISRMHLTEEEKDIQKRSLIPAMWGIIPRWHNGDYKKHGYHTNNARLEGLMDNRIYKPALVEGQRCVVLCEGFYEWSTIKDTDKKPYFIHAHQKNESIRIEDRSTWPERIEDLVLLKMAALFDIWTDDKGDQMWAYTVLTRESDNVLSWMHHRTPVILETDQQVTDWLDYKRIGPEEALAQLQPVRALVWHQVSPRVNNSRYKLEDCNKPGTQPPTKKTIKGRITSFFSVVKKEEPDNKKTKQDS